VAAQLVEETTQLFVQIQLPLVQVAEQVPDWSQVPAGFWPLLAAFSLHRVPTAPLVAARQLQLYT
jgi:hypothetical protein